MPGTVQESSACWGGAEQAQGAASSVISGPVVLWRIPALPWRAGYHVGLLGAETEERTVGYRP